MEKKPCGCAEPKLDRVGCMAEQLKWDLQADDMIDACSCVCHDDEETTDVVEN